MQLHPLLALAGTLVLAACANTAPAPADALVVSLAPSAANAGALGQATLLPTRGGTRIEVFFTEAGVLPSQPLHVYTFLYEGTCDQLPARPAFALTDQVLVRTAQGNLASTRRGSFTLSHNVPLSLDELMDGRYALALWAAPSDGGVLLYCGELRRT